MKWYKALIGDVSPEEYAWVYALLAEEKRKRIDRFRFEEDKKRSLAGELLPRRAVAELCGAAAERIVFETGENGKPFVPDLPVEFSISHSGQMAVCAADRRGLPVGIDVERVEPINLSVARRVGTPEELFRLFGHTPGPADFIHTEDRALLKRFYAFWTRKEAFVKCSGIGIAAIEQPAPEEGMQTFYDGDYVISIYQAR